MEKLFLNAQEVADELGTSKAYAYKLIQKLNEELETKGYITIQGKVNCLYFHEKIYARGDVLNASL